MLMHQEKIGFKAKSASALSIHMNGRVYDYNLARFLSVDPFIQAPGNSQSINPYSYILNNPLSGTDPSGYMYRNTVAPAHGTGGEGEAPVIIGSATGPCKTVKECLNQKKSDKDKAAKDNVSTGNGADTKQAETSKNSAPQLKDDSKKTETKKDEKSSSEMMGPPTRDEYKLAGKQKDSSTELSPEFAENKRHQNALLALRAAHAGTQEDGLEKGGLLYKNKDGSYGYTEKLIQGNTDSVDVWLAHDQVPAGAFIMGYFHSHPNNKINDSLGRFSVEDIKYADKKTNYPLDAYVITKDRFIDYRNAVNAKIQTIGRIR